ncbi:hypothetical protein LL946_06115 [Knoellia locipacati]|uniref:hypothetical protein n=1 Tax=Knoellia locipacati TaxID=882824 RepID=UPI0038502619
MSVPEPQVEIVDDVRRRLVGEARDGRRFEVLAARRGTTMRPGGSGGSTVGDGIVGAVVGGIVGFVLDAAVDVAADGRPWKVKAYRRRRFVIQRLHKEVLPRGVQPEERMREVLGHYIT